MTEKLNIRLLFYLGTSEPAGVQFVTDDGRVKFEIAALKDASGIEVRAPDTTKNHGTIYDTRVVVHPLASNVVAVRTMRWED